MEKNIEKAILQLEKYDFDILFFVKKPFFKINITKEYISEESDTNFDEIVKDDPGNNIESADSKNIVNNIFNWVGTSVGLTNIRVNTATNGTVWFTYELDTPDKIINASVHYLYLENAESFDILYKDGYFDGQTIVFMINEKSDGIYFPSNIQGKPMCVCCWVQRDEQNTVSKIK